MKITKRQVLDFFTIRRRNKDSSYYDVGWFWRGLLYVPFIPFVLIALLFKCIGEFFVFLWWVILGGLLELIVGTCECVHSILKEGEVDRFDIPDFGETWDNYRENSILFRR